MPSLRIALVHYHLRPGGVTSVLARTVSALAEHPIQVVVLCGDAAGAAERWGCPVRVVPGLDYAGDASPRRLEDDLLHAATEALGGPPDLWHIHNHAIGKSGALPLAVAALAQRGSPLLLHIHDFAEDGRPDNYQRLLTEVGEGDASRLGKRLYPTGAHIHYAVLNRRDQTFLIEAGCSPSRAHRLPNPIHLDKPTADIAPVPGLMIYPTRAIRRKNIGEFLLWSLLGPPGSRWQTTLEPKTLADRPVYERWCALARELNLPVDFAVGALRPRSMSDLLAGAEAVVTTSVAEGFGLSFLEPWLAGRPVFGRDLPDITADFKVAGVNLDSLYTRLSVPVDWVGRAALHAVLEKEFRRVRTSYARAYSEAELEAVFHLVLPGERVDVGHLPEPMQEQVLRRLADDTNARTEVHPEKLMTPIDPVLMEQNRNVIQTMYNEKAYGSRLWSVYQAVLGDSDATEPSALHAARLLDQFLAPSLFNLLRTT